MDALASEQALRELYAVTSARGLSFEDRLRTLLSLGCRRFQLPTALLTQVKDDSLEIVLCHPTNTTFPEGVRVPLEHTFCSATLTAEGPIAFEHAGASEWVTHPAYEALRLEAYLGTKVMRGEEVYGTLCFTGRAPHEECFTSADMDLLQLMARWVESELEREQAKQALVRSEHLLRSIINNTTAVIYVKWADGRYFLINNRYEQLFNVTQEEMAGKTDYDIFPKEIADAFRENDVKVLSTRGPIESEEYAPHEDGLHMYISVKFPLLDENGMAYATCGISTDITELKRTQEALLKSEERRIVAFKQSDSLKTALLDSVSHELRTPLATIKTTISAMLGHRSKANPALYEGLLQEVNHEVDDLARLVENLLDMSRVGSGLLQPGYEGHPFEELLEGALARFGSELKARKLDVDLPADLPVLWVDGSQIQLVLRNVIDNALKYSVVHTPIRIQGRVRAGELEVKVVSMGEVVPEEDRARIFERFYRVPTKRAHPVRGTGLGLAICQAIVKGHGGRIWAESPSKWTTAITFTVPIDPRLSSPSNRPL